MKQIGIIFLFISCFSSSHHLQMIDQTHYFDIKDLEFKKSYLNSWQVGAGRKVTVSKGVSVNLNLPALDERSALFLYEKYGFDSFLIQVDRFSLHNDPFKAYAIVKVINGNSFKNVPNIYINIYYSALAISSRLENINCPSMNHNLLITDFDALTNNVGARKLVINSAEKIVDKLEQIGLAPVVLNFGNTLKGLYQFKLALFDSQKNNKISNFIDYNQILRIKREKIVFVPGCGPNDRPTVRQEEIPTPKFFSK